MDDTGDAALARWSTKRIALICLLVASLSAAARIVCVWQLRDNPVAYQHLWDQSDMHFYDQWARDLAAGDWLQDRALHPLHGWHLDMAHVYLSRHPDAADRIVWEEPQTAPSPEHKLWDEWYGQKRIHQEPLYPYLVAATYRLLGDDVHRVFVWQLFLGCVTNVLIYLLARELMGEIPALVAGLLAVGYGPMLYYETLLLRESTLVFATVAVMYLATIARRRRSAAWWTATGFALGLALLLKTTLSIFLFAALAAILWNERKRLRSAAIHAGALLGAVAIAFSPAIVRNLRVGVSPLELSSVGTVTFVNANVADPDNHQFGFFWSPALTPEIMGRSHGRFFPGLWLTLKTHHNVDSVLSMLGNKFWWMCNWYENPNNANFYFYREMLPVLRWLPVSFLMIAPLALIGLLLGAKDWFRWWPVYAMTATNVAVMLGFYVNSRMRIPIVPELILFAALTVGAIIEWIRQKKWALATVAAISIVAAGWFVARPIPRDRPIIRADDYLVPYLNYVLPELKRAQDANDPARAAQVVEAFLTYEPSQLDDMDASHPTNNDTNQSIAQIFAAAHLREARLIGNLDAVASNWHLKRAHDLMAAAGKPTPF